MKIRAFVAVALAVLSVPAVAADPPAKHPITHEDVWLMTRVSASRGEPGWPLDRVQRDGTRRTTTLPSPATSGSCRADGSQPPRKLTAGKAGEGDVAWSPDSTRIAFTAKREGDDENQAYVLQLVNGGDAQRVTNLVGGASAPVWSPDGRKLLVTTRVYAGTRNDAENRKAPRGA